jgi:hypothetical protein
MQGVCFDTEVLADAATPAAIRGATTYRAGWGSAAHFGMQACRMTASLRATAMEAGFQPMRLASRSAHIFSGHDRRTRIMVGLADAANRSRRTDTVGASDEAVGLCAFLREAGRGRQSGKNLAEKPNCERSNRDRDLCPRVPLINQSVFLGVLVAALPTPLARARDIDIGHRHADLTLGTYGTSCLRSELSVVDG